MALSTDVGKANIEIGLKNTASAGLDELNQDIRQTGSSAQEATNSGSGFDDMLGDWRVQALAVAASVAAVVKGIDELATRGAGVLDLREGFAQTGFAISDLRSATSGLIRDFDLMRLGNQAAMMGLTAEQFKTLAAYADMASDSLGKDLVPTLEQLMQAVVAGSADGFRPFGIILESTPDKVQAVTSALSAMDEQLGVLPANFQKNNDSIQALSASWSNLGDEFAVAVAQTPEVKQAYADLKVELDALVVVLPDIISFVRKFYAIMKVIANPVGEAAFAIEQLWESILMGSPEDAEVIDVLDDTDRAAQKVDRSLTSLVSGYDAFVAAQERAAKAPRINSRVDEGPIVDPSAKIATLAFGLNWALQLQTEYARKAMAMKVSSAEADAAFEDQVAQNAIDRKARLAVVLENQTRTQLANEAKIQQEAADKGQMMWNVFGSNIASAWSKLWTDIGAGNGVDNILSIFLGMLGQMATQFGTMAMSMGFAMMFLPGMQGMATGAIAAGLALVALGGLLTGLSSSAGGASEPASGSFGGNGSNAFGTPTGEAPKMGGNTYITVVNGFSTVDDLARAHAESGQRAAQLGYI